MVLEVVDDASGGAHDHIHSVAEGAGLGFEGNSAVDWGDPNRKIRRRFLQVLRDLETKLAGGHDDEGAGCAVEFGDVGVVEHSVEERNAEAEGFAGARAGLADDVFAVQSERNAELLDGEWFVNVLRG